MLKLSEPTETDAEPKRVEDEPAEPPERTRPTAQSQQGHDMNGCTQLMIRTSLGPRRAALLVALAGALL